MAKPLTGRKVFAMFVAGFGTIIAANLALAVNAVRTFPGLEVKNSYVASQGFDARRAAQKALGWTVTTELTDSHLQISLTHADGSAVSPASLSVTLGRPATDVLDQEVPVTWDGAQFRAPVSVEPGLWLVRIEALAVDGTAFTQLVTVRRET